MRVTGSRWFALRRATAQHPWFIKLVVGLMLLGFLFLMMHRRTREREAREAFRADCASRAIGEDECDDLLDRHHTRCFAMSFQTASKSGTPEHLDLPRYLECVRISPKAWSAQRRKLLKEQERARREERDALR